ncbi:hypothetical protein EBM89_02970 [Cellulomonas triticagri]|uniref:Uncharacterized protein n=1 Tax=Cellulomonas triticagri TaxID=2483352 RepID=A0A3M2JL15_9CELL|nr:hypothetical protein EBM89_02970 [Cellulomonas triticagri]
MDEVRVPVEHRWLGMDRRSIPYALVALGVIALWAWVAPWVAAQVAWDDPIRAGEAIQVTDGTTLTAAPGWGVVSGLRTTDDTRSGQESAQQTVLVKDGVVFSILQGPFTEEPDRLLAQAERITGAGSSGFHVSGDERAVTTASGLRGVEQDFTSASSTGTVTAFVVDGTGIEIQVVGAPAQVTALTGEVDAMIASLTAEEATR